ncbi:MAG TPA: L-threonylcarbamoyladenylate synthase [Anaerolineales bacterium]
MNTRLISADEPQAIDHAVALLCEAALVAFPTDTVYGLAAAIDQPRAINRLFEAKGRPEEKAVPVLLADRSQLDRVASQVAQPVLRLAEAFWPGPLTLIVPKADDLPAELSSLPTIGVRVPDHPVALALLRATGPLAVTSANRSGRPDCLTAGAVKDQLDGLIELIVDGGLTPGGRPSTVAAMEDTELRVLREGPISLAVMRAALAS